MEIVRKLSKSMKANSDLPSADRWLERMAQAQLDLALEIEMLQKAQAVIPHLLEQKRAEYARLQEIQRRRLRMASRPEDPEEINLMWTPASGTA